MEIVILSLCSTILSAFFATTIASFHPSHPSPCSKDDFAVMNSTNCLIAISQAAEDKSRFWFGEKYAISCQEQSKFSSDCYNPISGKADSLVSRIFRRKVFDRNKLKSILKIAYKTHTGSYQACGNAYEIYKSRTIYINDPLIFSSDQSLLPFELLSTPMVSWKNHTSLSASSIPTFHTLAIIDAGYVTINALYVNIPGSSLNGGQTIVEYQPPTNPTSNDNPYVFLLFDQYTSIELSPQWLHNLSLRSLDKLEDFLIEFDLEGPVGISWFTVRADPFSADDAHNSPGNMNTCAQFVNKAFVKDKLPYLPDDSPDLNVFLDITFKSPEIVFSCCCNTYSYQASIYKPNPIGNGEAKAVLMRTACERNFVFRKSTAFPLQSRDFKDELHTLIMIDPDLPLAIYGSPQRPYVHMLVSNIREGEFKSGQVVLPYSGPWPPDPDHHTYYFLLFKQKMNFQPRSEDYAFMNCSGVFNGRCGFNMAAMIQDGDLELVGASWQLMKSTDYVRCVLVNLGAEATEICAGVEGYKPNCTRQLDHKDHSKNDGNTGCSHFTRTCDGFINNLLFTLHAILVMYWMA